jgi:hypothetical protein
MSTTDLLNIFDLSDISEGHDGLIPPEVVKHPLFAKKAKHFLGLQERFQHERAAIHALATEAPSAVEADRHALAVAMAADEDDPGNPAVETLAEKVQVARRRMGGLSTALDGAYRDLVDALDEHREAWFASLDHDGSARREKAAKLLDELDCLLVEGESPAAACRWYVQAIDTMRRNWGGLPHLNVAAEPVAIHGASVERASVLAALLDAVQ